VALKSAMSAIMDGGKLGGVRQMAALSAGIGEWATARHG